MKEKKAQKHKKIRTQEHNNTNIFLGETRRDKTLQNILGIDLNKSSVKPRQLLLTSLWSTSSSLSWKTTWVSEYKWRGAPPYLYYSVELTSNLTWMTFLTDWADLSNLTQKITFIILTLGYYWSNLHPEVYINSFKDSNKNKLIYQRRNTINTYGIYSKVIIL